MSNKVAVLLIVFKRPELTASSWACVRRYAPEKLYIFSDGPRLEVAGERELCEEARKLTEDVDWPCEVHRDYSEINRGPRGHFARAFEHVFAHEDRLIQVEDDDVPDPTFFSFCEEMLERYLDDKRIMSVSGWNMQDTSPYIDSSYFFSRYSTGHGWATWRRTWEKYDVHMKTWPETRRSSAFRDGHHSGKERRYWDHVFSRTHAGHVDTWDYQFALLHFLRNGLSVRPTKNLVANSGYGPHGTNTRDPNAPGASRSSFPMTFPLVHPPRIEANKVYDKEVSELFKLARFDKRVCGAIRRTLKKCL